MEQSVEIKKNRFNFDANTIEDAREYMFSRAKQLLKHGYKSESWKAYEWGIDLTFSRNNKKFQSLYILKDFRNKGIYQNQIWTTILTSVECGISDYLLKNNIDFVEEKLVPFTEYEIISDFYGEQKAKRSGVFLMNHIDEGLFILNKINSSLIAKKAYCLHPILQGDESLCQNKDLVIGCDCSVIIASMEYRSVANEYLSNRTIQTINDIRLSPLKDVNDMLIADKIQNRKDFELYHKNTHPRSKELTEYFNNWFERLGITEEFYKDCVKICS
jgi:hypothetical protein